MIDLIFFCTYYGGKKLKKWILVLIASNYGDIWDEWKPGKKALKLPEADREFIEDEVSQRKYFSFAENFKSLYWK